MDNNVTLVVFAEVKSKIIGMLEESKKKLENGRTIGNTSITLEELEKLIKLSGKKIITYSNLIKRDINSAMVYWS